MSTNKNHAIDLDLSGRIMSLEQRMKGLQGRIAAIETRLSRPRTGNLSGNEGPVEDFIPAMNCSDITVDYPGDKPETMKSSPRSSQFPETVETKKPVISLVDTTGLIAGMILIGAGLLLFSGNLDIIKNPFAAIGCGILLIGGALKRIVL